MPLKFVLADKPIVVKWPVYLPEPQDGGTIKKHKITVHFLAEPTEVQQERWKQMNDRTSSGDPHAALKAQQEMLEAVFVGWDEVWGEDDQPLAFTDETRDRMVAYPWRRDAILDAYNQMAKGQKAKN